MTQKSILRVLLNYVKCRHCHSVVYKYKRYTVYGIRHYDNDDNPEDTTMSDSFFDTAVRWKQQGVSCLPCQPGTKFLIKGVSPKHFLSNPPDLGQYYKWFVEQNCNLAILTGGGLAVLDFDDLGSYQGWQGPESYTVITRRGVHVYLWVAEEVNHTSPLCEIKYNQPVIAPPSIVGGYKYRVFYEKPIARVGRIEDI